jgi:hypothetical protein
VGKGWVYLNSQKSKNQAKNLLENYQFFAGSWRGTGGCLIPRIFKKPKQVVYSPNKRPAQHS